MGVGAVELGGTVQAGNYKVELSGLALEQLRQMSPAESHRIIETCCGLVRLCGAASAAAAVEPDWSSFLEEAGRLVLYSVQPRRGRVRVHRLVTRAPVPGGPAPSLAGVKVLVVEDDPRLREGMRELLEGMRAEVRTAADAQEALGQLDRARPDVLVSDIGLPGLDGYDLIRRVRRQAGLGRGFAAVALTACTTAADRARALEAGFDVHLGKPVEPAALRAAIARLLERRPPGPHSAG